MKYLVMASVLFSLVAPFKSEACDNLSLSARQKTEIMGDLVKIKKATPLFNAQDNASKIEARYEYAMNAVNIMRAASDYAATGRDTPVAAALVRIPLCDPNTLGGSSEQAFYQNVHRCVSTFLEEAKTELNQLCVLK